MSLKSIFSLVLTNDGKRYNAGDISEKTGLQKQPDGSWAPPKRSGKSTSIPFNPKTLEYKEKNSKGEWETKKFEPEELLEEMQEMRKEYKTANKKDSLERIDREIAGLQEYIKNQNNENPYALSNLSGNRTSSAGGQKSQGRANTEYNILNQHPYADEKDLEDFYNEEMKGFKTEKEYDFNPEQVQRRFDQWYARNRHSKHYGETMEKGKRKPFEGKKTNAVHTKENQNKTTDSACRLTADTKIRLKK